MPGHLSAAGGGIRLIGVDVHRERGLVGHADHSVAEYQLPSGLLLDFDGNHLAVVDTEPLGVGGGHVDMPKCDDGAFLEIEFAAGAYNLAGCGAGHVAALPDRGDYAERARVGERKLHLILGTHGSENRTLEAGLGADNLNLLVGGVLAGLGERFLHLQFESLTEEDVESFACHMHVTGRCLNDEIVHICCMLSLLV